MAPGKNEVCVQPWCNPLWLTGLKAPTNLITGDCEHVLYYASPSFQHTYPPHSYIKHPHLIWRLHTNLSPFRARALRYDKHSWYNDSKLKTSRALNCELNCDLDIVCHSCVRSRTRRCYKLQAWLSVNYTSSGLSVNYTSSGLNVNYTSSELSVNYTFWTKRKLYVIWTERKLYVIWTERKLYVIWTERKIYVIRTERKLYVIRTERKLYVIWTERKIYVIWIERKIT